MAAHPLPARAGAHPGPVPEREERKSLVQIRCNACGLQNDIESRALCPGTCCWSPRCELSACPAQLDARLPNSLRPSSQRPTNLPMMTTKFRMVTILMITFVTCCPMRECIGRDVLRLCTATQNDHPRPAPAMPPPVHPTQFSRSARVRVCGAPQERVRMAVVDLSGHSTSRQIRYRGTMVL